MLRPATPLTVLLFTAFAFLLLSVISTPIIKQIALASFGGVDFGVFGFCQGTKCSKIEIGYSTVNLFDDAQSASFDLPTNTSGARTTLSAILIVHPIAALLTLIMLILGATAHFHSPSHSPRYLLGIFILSILTLIASLLAFLIDVLLFAPHMAWGSWLVLAATILIAASGIVSCAMRRTLVSRKARKRRIAENAEMNGENFYNRQAATAPPVMTSANNIVNGAPGADKLPAFAQFETGKKSSDETSDERLPLTGRTPSETSPGDGSQRPNDPYALLARARSNLDQYGNPMRPPPGSYGMRSRDPSADPSLNRQYSDSTMRGGPDMRGRGGYRGRPTGGPLNPARGNYGPPRGAYGPPSRGYGPPRGGYGGPYRGGMNDPRMAGMAGGMAAGAMMRGGRGGPPGYNYDNRGMSPAGAYGRRPSPPDAYQRPPQAGEYVAYSADDQSSLPRAESPPPLPGLEEGVVGQAVEMDATTGSPSTAPSGFGHFGNLRESDGDVAGMVGLQQQRLQRHTVDSDASRYSGDETYVPPRQGWHGGEGTSSPLSRPAELPGPITHRRANSGDNYYEDVEPQFAEPQITAPSPVPAASAPGYGPSNNAAANLRPLQPVGNLDGNGSYEDLQSGARSPAESDRSNFTSVSQRGVNPRWNGQPGYAPMPNRRPVPQQQDILLNSNPDFQIPGRGGRGNGRGGGRGPSPAAMIPGSAYPGV